MPLSRDEAAVSSLFSYGIAGIIFVGSIAALLLATQELNGHAVDAGDPGNAHLAQAVARSMVERDGTGWSSPTAWSLPGTAGLAVAPGAVSQGRLDTLSSAGHAAGIAGSPEYAVVAEALRLNDAPPDDLGLHDLGLGFHLRGVPTLSTDDLALEVAYIGRNGDPVATAELALLDGMLVAPATPYTDNAVPAGNVLTNSMAVDVLVVGSNVDPTIAVSGMNAMLAADFTLPNWFDSGGTVIVLGSADADLATWQDQLLDEPLVPASSPLRPGADPFHPLLRVPHALLPSCYARDGDPMDLGAPGFHTLWSDGEPVVRYSVPGGHDAFGSDEVSKGQFIEVRLNPTEAAAGDHADPDCNGAAAQAERILRNLLVRHHRYLFLDYGPSIPEGVEARPGVATAMVAPPAGMSCPASPCIAPAGMTDIPIRFEAYVFARPQD